MIRYPPKGYIFDPGRYSMISPAEDDVLIFSDHLKRFYPELQGWPSMNLFTAWGNYGEDIYALSALPAAIGGAHRVGETMAKISTRCQTSAIPKSEMKIFWPICMPNRNCRPCGSSRLTWMALMICGKIKGGRDGKNTYYQVDHRAAEKKNASCPDKRGSCRLS